MGKPAQTRFDPADDDRCFFVGTADQIPVYDRGMIRSVIRQSKKCVGIRLSVLFGNIVMVYHGIHISRTDQKAEPWLS